MYELTINDPAAQKGQEFSIPGLGTYPNGSTVVVSKEDADAFRAYQTDNGMPDRTLLQAFQSSALVTVTTVKAPDEKKEGDK